MCSQSYESWKLIKLAYLEPQEMYALKGIKYKYLQAFLLREYILILKRLGSNLMQI